MQTYSSSRRKKGKKTNIGSKEEGTIYCLSCRDYTGNIASKKLKMTNKVITEKSSCAD